jgi:glycosyltransferase involved in cell wall biosynthesis
MIKVYIPSQSNMSVGGGWTAMRNLIKGGRGLFEVVDNLEDCDILLIMGATLVQRDVVQRAKDLGKKIVFRVDNMVKDSRNRGTGVSRVRDYSLMADYIIFQSKWAMEYVGWWLQKKVKSEAMNTIGRYSVIFNGVDTDAFFYKDEPVRRKEEYLYVQQNRDENKRPTEAFYHFAMLSRKIPNIRLTCVGNFSPDIVKYNFDFFDEENVRFIPTIENPKELGDIMRESKYLLFPAFCDASPNTVAEALACGMVIKLVNNVGGTKEVINYHYSWRYKRKETYSIQNMAYAYNEIFKQLIK